MAVNLTTIRDLPKKLIKQFTCSLFHEKDVNWDGTYYYNSKSQSFIPNVKYTCKVCDKDVETK